MLIQCLGHAKFLLQTDAGQNIVTDPFDPSTGYPVGRQAADLVLVSHQHHDHNAVGTLTGNPAVIDQAGSFDALPGVRVTAVEAYHDDAKGVLRGKTLLFVLEADGVRVAHLGDLGHIPEEDTVRALGRIDVLLIPVGGHFTIDAAQALKVCELLHPAVVVPMHYRTAYNSSWPIAPADDFLSIFPARAEHLRILRVTGEDLACQPALAVLEPVFG